MEGTLTFARFVVVAYDAVGSGKGGVSETLAMDFTCGGGGVP